MGLDLQCHLAARHLEVSLAVPDGVTLALLGANGSGKSSVLSVLAGLLVPDSGEATLNGRTLFSLGIDGERTWLPPHRRGTALLAQDPLLFPHLRAVANVAFGPRSRGVSKAESRRIATEWLAEVGAERWAFRKPGELSGGQAQRIALARALAADPELMLLDEPFNALDVEVAAMMRQTLSRVLDGRTTVLVTHEILDAVLLADMIAVMADGRIVEVGDTARVMRQPRSAFAANLCGLNMQVGRVTDAYCLRVDTATADADRSGGFGGEGAAEALEGAALAGVAIHGQSGHPLKAGARAVAVFQPGAVSVYRRRPDGSPRNVFRGKITALEPQAHLIRVRVGEVAADITAAAVRELDLVVGARVYLAVKAAEVSLYEA